MKLHQKTIAASSAIVLLAVMLNVVVISAAYTAGPRWYWGLLLTLPLLGLAVHDVQQERYPLIRNYPVIGRLLCFF